VPLAAQRYRRHDGQLTFAPVSPSRKRQSYIRKLDAAAKLFAVARPKSNSTLALEKR
jgi:hypothetical protein